MTQPLHLRDRYVWDRSQTGVLAYAGRVLLGSDTVQRWSLAFCEDVSMAQRNLAAGLIVTVLSLAAAGCGQATSLRSVATEAVTSRELPPRCPHRRPASIPPNTWGPTRSKLAPLGAAAIRLCRYAELPTLRLRDQTLVTTSGLIRMLLADFNQLPVLPERVRCPIDLGSAVFALIAYPHGHRDTIGVWLTGCSYVRNGNLVRSASGFGTTDTSGPKLRALLRRLTESRDRSV
jgi:hypothetical protein